MSLEMMKYLPFCLSIIFSSSCLLAQNAFVLRSSIGVTHHINAFDGYYFGFDLGIPLLKGIQLAPTFTHTTIGPIAFIETGYSKHTEGITFGTPVDYETKDYEQQDVISSISLLLLFNPLDIFLSEKSNHEIWLGGCIGYKSYVQYSLVQDPDYHRGPIFLFNTKLASTFEPFYFKFMYNYSFASRLLAGISLAFDGYDGETFFASGLNFGVRF